MKLKGVLILGLRGCCVGNEGDCVALGGKVDRLVNFDGPFAGGGV